MGLFDKFKKTEQEEDKKVEWLTFKEVDWAKARDIIFVNGRHVDLVRDKCVLNGDEDQKVVTYTVLVELTREEAIDMYAKLLSAGIKEFVDNSKQGNR